MLVITTSCQRNITCRRTRQSREGFVEASEHSSTNPQRKTESFGGKVIAAGGLTVVGTRDSTDIVLVTTGTCCARASSAIASGATVPTILFCHDRGPGLKKWDTKDPGNPYLTVPATLLLS